MHQDRPDPVGIPSDPSRIRSCPDRIGSDPGGKGHPGPEALEVGGPRQEIGRPRRCLLRVVEALPSTHAVLRGPCRPPRAVERADATHTCRRVPTGRGPQGLHATDEGTHQDPARRTDPTPPAPTGHRRLLLRLRRRTTTPVSDQRRQDKTRGREGRTREQEPTVRQTFTRRWRRTDRTRRRRPPGTRQDRTRGRGERNCREGPGDGRSPCRPRSTPHRPSLHPPPSLTFRAGGFPCRPRTQFDSAVERRTGTEDPDPTEPKTRLRPDSDPTGPDPDLAGPMRGKYEEVRERE